MVNDEQTLTVLREDPAGNMFVEQMDLGPLEVVDLPAELRDAPACDCCGWVLEDGCGYSPCTTKDCSACSDLDCKCCAPNADKYTILGMPKALAEMLGLDDGSNEESEA
jgi:hypothetical protein